MLNSRTVLQKFIVIGLFLGIKGGKMSKEQTNYVKYNPNDTVYATFLKKEDLVKQFVFCFKDGKKAVFKTDKDCQTMQDFLDRMNKVHELENENKKLKEQLEEANRLLKYYLQDGVLVQFASGDYVDPRKDAKLYFEKWGVK